MTTEPTLALAELERWLDVYGSDPKRWPAAEWEAAARLVAQSAEARAVWDEAVALDHMLAGLPPVEVSPVLVDRVLADAPRRRLPARWRRAMAAAVPLAAAAGVALWVFGNTTAGIPAPKAVDLTSIELGEYASPTDYLLESYGVDVTESAPALGCDDSTLGCPSLDDESTTDARSRV
jgi:hypothetical protein